MRSFTFLILLYFSFNTCFSQEDTTKYAKAIKFCCSYDNDVFLATDRYYTQGIYLDLIAPFVKKSPISYLLIPINKNANNEYGLELEQDVFTPYSILHEGIYYNERPYTATLFVSHHLTSNDVSTNQILETKLDIGIMGPAAGGEQMQKGIHRALDNAMPRGWNTQLANDAMLNYNVRYKTNIISKEHGLINSIFDAKIGTIYDDIGIGFEMKAGALKHKKKFGIQLFGNTIIKAVGYNATLQGGMFNRSSVYSLSGNQMERVVLTAEGGIVFLFRKFEIEYASVYTTAEFDKAFDHGWGHVCFLFRL